MSTSADAGVTDEAEIAAALDGRMVIVRRAGDAEGARALERQAEVLAACAGRGAVELLSLHREGDDLVLVAAAVDGPPLAAAGLSPAEIAGALAGLARALAALHLRSLVHGAVTLDNVRIRRSDGEAVLGLPSPGGPEGPRLAADDVGGLGAILLALAGDRPGDAVTGLRRRAAATGMAAGQTDDQVVAALRAIGTWAADPDPARRPGAEGVATALERLAPARPVRGLFLPARPRSAKAPSRRPRRAVTAGAVAAGVLVALLGAVAALAAMLGPGQAPARSPARARAVPARPPAAQPSRPPPPGPGCPSRPAGPAADVDGDGCEEPITVAGTEIAVGAFRFAAAQAGDVVTVGDWDCDGQATPAVLDTATGDLFLFDRWPAAPDEALTVGPEAAVPGAIGARGDDVDGDGCDEVILERRDAPPAVVRPTRSAPPARTP